MPVLGPRAPLGRELDVLDAIDELLEPGEPRAVSPRDRDSSAQAKATLIGHASATTLVLGPERHCGLRRVGADVSISRVITLGSRLQCAMMVAVMAWR